MTGVLSASPAVEAAVEAVGDHESPIVLITIAVICGIWFCFILIVQTIGTVQLYRHYSSTPNSAFSEQLSIENIPHVTILRPVKGPEPQLYECLAATFRQTYPLEKLTVHLCVPSRSDPAYPTLERLLSDFPRFDAKLFVEEEDPLLSGDGGESNRLGPNPKIRNMSRGYREAKGDILWALDCNVWVGKGVLGRMVDRLCGFGPVGTGLKPCKFVHHLPIVVDGVGASDNEETRCLLSGDQIPVASSSTTAHDIPSERDMSTISRITNTAGGRLEEMFMAGSHAKFYTAINTVAVAPCIVGKSNMLRRSHLDYLTSSGPQGIDFFSHNICEDHLIGDLFWRSPIREEIAGQKYGKHALVFGDLVIQPMAGMSIREYIARRVRWLRVRKWTVPLATIVEPGVEPFLCSAYGSFALTTIPWIHRTFSISQTWTVFFLLWCFMVGTWAILDRFVYVKLHSGSSVELDEDTPSFARPPTQLARRPVLQWFLAWMGREMLALPVWTFAVLGGTTVVWRNRTFWVGMDMRVHEIKNGSAGRQDLNRDSENDHPRSHKDRQD